MVSPAIDMLSVFMTPWMKPTSSHLAISAAWREITKSRSVRYRFAAAEFLADPYPTYRALRQLDPVHRMPDGSYFLTRYHDCLSVYRETETRSSDKKLDFRPNFAAGILYEHHTTSLVFNDPPYHTRVRKLLAPAFTPRALRVLKHRIENLVDRLLEAAAEKGEIDLIADFASAIPVQLIGDMLGIPRDERGPLGNSPRRTARCRLAPVSA
jgi:cytochrome P450